jgi:DNA-binding ferritin-like protein
MNKDFKNKLFEEVKKRGLLEQEEKTSGGLKDIVSALFHSRNQTHIFHLQTDSQSSFAEHMALGGYYDEIGDLIDGLVESYQGKHGIIKGYTTEKIEDYQDVKQVISYLEKLDSIIEKSRKSIKESYIQNQIDTVQELIYSTLYKLKFLK